MKMEHPMTATADGVVRELRVAKGQQVESGALLLVVEPDVEAGVASEAAAESQGGAKRSSETGKKRRKGGS